MTRPGGDMPVLERFVFVTDIHGDGTCPETANALESFIGDFKPHHLICGGDLFDFRNFRKGACPAEKADSVMEDVKAGMRWLERFQPDHWTLGNHDDRVWDEARSAQEGAIQDLCRMLAGQIEDKAKRVKCQMYPYDVRPESALVMHGAMFIHGFMHNMHCAKATAERMLTVTSGANTVFAGHSHRPDTATLMNGGKGVIAPCACLLFPGYSDRTPASRQWANGWVAGHLNTRTNEVSYQVVSRSAGQSTFNAYLELKTYGKR